MLTLIEIAIMRFFEIIFFIGMVGCVVTIVLSWYSIAKEEFRAESSGLSERGPLP